VTRRLALSLAISGEREPALRLLEDQLLVRDRAGERTRALVLALSGDAAGATRAVQAAMPGPQAGAMAPFLARLPSLSLAERALAVHLGVFPGDGRTAAPAAYAANDAAVPPSVTEAGRPDASQGSLARRIVVPEPVSGAPRRRPGARQVPTAAGDRTAAVAPPVRSRGAGGANPAWAWSRGPVTTQRDAEAKPKPAEPIPVRTEPWPQIAGAAAAAPGARAAEPEPVSVQTAEASHPPAEPQLQPSEMTNAAAQLAAAPPPEPEPVPTASRLADLSAAIDSIPEADTAPPPTAAKPKPAAKPPAARRAASPPPRKAKPAPPAEPSRVWVQVAGGADKRALPREFARLKAKAPKLLAARGAWTTSVNATNRLLVGPFAGAKEAQAFVNQLKAQQLSGFAWTSAAGQKIEKLPAK
jgi:sporulation related protein